MSASDADKLLAIQKLISKRGGCLCGHFESCEWCDRYSAVNSLRREIREVLEGPRAPEEYGRTIKIAREQLG